LPSDAPSATAVAIDALLPQTQCTRCGYAGCRPYAEAIAAGEAPINQCPPGGAATIAALAALTGRPALPLNPDHGLEGPATVAVIDEAACIGCARCLPPCPVDAIVGAQRRLHTVLYALCTGCELCVAPCPVDCITIVPRASLAPPSAPAPGAGDNRRRFVAREARLVGRASARRALLETRKRSAAAVATPIGQPRPAAPSPGHEPPPS
jgi:Na+-translocating ferredoxin:NAD+ oxidoreductase subunit B